MHDEKDMKAVADKLPSGVVSMLFSPDLMNDVEILATGICLQNQQRDDEFLDITSWLKFDSAASAEAALEYVEYMFGNAFGITQTSIQLRGQFIEITGETAISDW